MEIWGKGIMEYSDLLHFSGIPLFQQVILLKETYLNKNLKFEIFKYFYLNNLCLYN